MSERLHGTITRKSAPSLNIRDTISELENLAIGLANTTGVYDEIASILERVSALARAHTLNLTCALALWPDSKNQVEVIKQHFAPKESPSNSILPTEAISDSTGPSDPERSAEEIKRASYSRTLTDQPYVEVKRHPNPFFPHLYVPVTDETRARHVMWQ